MSLPHISGSQSLQDHSSQSPRTQYPPLHRSLVYATVPGHGFIRHGSRDTGHFEATPRGRIHSWKERWERGGKVGLRTRALSATHTSDPSSICPERVLTDSSTYACDSPFFTPKQGAALLWGEERAASDSGFDVSVKTAWARLSAPPLIASRYRDTACRRGYDL